MSSKNKYNPQPESSRSTYILGGLAVLVIAVLVIGGVIWQSNRSKPRNDGYGGVQNSEVQVALQDDGVVLLGRPDAATTVDLFEDPMCPYCAELENKNGQELAQAIDDGKVAVRYHVLNFLDQLSASGDYSTRAVAASECVAETGDAVAYSAFHAALFSPSNQPKENGSSDHTNEELAQIAGDAGASDEAVQCITAGAKVEQARAHAEAGRQALAASGATGTPAVVEDGTVIDALSNENWVSQL
ncbi:MULTISPECIES: DsbA family protein [Rhodococcus]|uniref:Serine/threonine-protein kinase n=1 Tax=Rhodococcus opacus RKJ300 = JCM 13270 TaxID=1165867 RepID=I0WUY1_RHOOP|nr:MULTISPECIES: DsbA family protein [Rhodococcus]EID80197.1 serine/threonine-protein kinase [Rhodococcus opacus RKJ300 = JCM 13270]QQZ11650.1 DsbA family protein [Rhodococcus sp. 21391]